MRRTSTIALVGLAGAAAIAVTSARRTCSRPGEPSRNCEYETPQGLRGFASRVSYLLGGGRPDPDVADLVLADRVRSTIGPVVKRLDLPHIHVMVTNHVALLHGDVATTADAAAVEQAVASVSGVRGVESFLHVGLIASDTRPSAGRASPQPPSPALATLLRFAERGRGGRAPATLVRAVLSSFLDVVPDDERRHVLSHLPDDVRALADPPRRSGAVRSRTRTTAELMKAITTSDPDLEPADAESAAVGVLATLRELIPEEVDDLDACLPRELRMLWRRAGVVARDRFSTAHTYLHLLEQT